MFERRIFGRKSVSAPPSFQPVADVGGGLTYDALAQRVTLGLIGRQTNVHSWTRALTERLAALSAIERGEVFVSLASYAVEIDRIPSRDDPDQDADRKRLCYTECQYKPYDVAPDALREYVALIAGTPRHSCSHYAAKRIVPQIKKTIAAGGFLTSHECILLAGYAEGLRAAKAYQKADKKQYAELAAAVDKIAGVEASASAILLDRCEDAETGHAIGDLPENFDFWMALFAATARAMGALFEDVRARTPPAWMQDPAAFAAAFPAVGPFTPRFGAWNDSEHESVRDFAFLRELRKRIWLAGPERYLALRDQRAVVEPIVRIAWNTPAIPGVERLGDLESPAVTDLLELFVTSKGGPHPTASWVRKALTIAGEIGIGEVEARLHNWLALFHTPCSTPEMMAAASNCYRMDAVVHQLNEAYPTWPARITPDDTAACGRALALGLAGGNSERLPAVWMASLFVLDVQVYKGRKHGQDTLRLPSPGRAWYGVTTQTASFENEQLLRAVIWMLPALPDTAAAIGTLEKTARAASCRMWFNSDSIRSKTVANAAVAALVAIDSGEARLALLRLSQQIEDRTISAPIMAALNA